MTNGGRHVRAIAMLLAALTAPAAAEDRPTVAFDFQDVELSVVARFVSEVTGRNFILDDRVRGRITIISPTEVSAEDAYGAFQAALAVKGFTTVETASFVKILPMREARGAPTEPGGPDDVVTRILTVRHANVASLEPVLSPLVSPDGVLTVHPDSGRVVVVDTGASTDRIAALVEALDRPGRHEATRLVPLEHADAEDLALRLREALGADPVTLVAEPRANALLLTGPPDAVARASRMVTALDAERAPGGRDLWVYRLRHGSAEHLVEVLAQILGLPTIDAESDSGAPDPTRAPRGTDEEEAPRRRPLSTGSRDAEVLDGPVRVTADPATNALLVSATRRDWGTIERVIQDLDVARRQVFVEAIILEATADKVRTLGIDLRSAGTSGSALGLAQVNLSSLGMAAGDPTSIPGLILAAASNETIALPDGTEVPAHTLLLTALDTESDVDVLSAPTIVTTDNEEAEIVVGRNVPFVASRATDATNLENLFTTIERRDVGITLRMTPQILADDYVRLTLFEEVSDIDEVATAALGDPALLGPTTTVRSTSTVVAARDGQTVVIGGLLADTLRITDRSVPFVSRVPVLGHLFRSEGRRRVKTNLLVFLTPHVISSDAEFASRSAAGRAAFPHDGPHDGVLHGRSWEAPAPGTP
jgi:general secretion pathway protein D